MANNENLIPIPGRLHSVATEGHVSGADEIYDDTQQKDQETINSELIAAVGAEGSVASRIAAAKAEIIGSATSACDTLGKAEALISAEATRAEAAEEALDGRVDTLEDAVGTDGSVDERIAEEGTKHYLKEETYNKTELNNMITTPNQKYVSVIATAQTTAVTDVLPATGEADTIYRVGSWDGTQYDATCYSEYAWKGDAYIHLSTKPQIGEVFDISAYKATGGTLATFADLSAALDNGNNIPQTLRKGGMSVKFVQRSDNKYVQYRLMADSWSTTPSDWQGVDDEPTAGSHNLVKSGGVSNNVFALKDSIEQDDILYTKRTNLYKDEIYAKNGWIGYDKLFHRDSPGCNRIYRFLLHDIKKIRIKTSSYASDAYVAAFYSDVSADDEYFIDEGSTLALGNGVFDYEVDVPSNAVAVYLLYAQPLGPTPTFKFIDYNEREKGVRSIDVNYDYEEVNIPLPNYTSIYWNTITNNTVSDSAHRTYYFVNDGSFTRINLKATAFGVDSYAITFFSDENHTQLLNNKSIGSYGYGSFNYLVDVPTEAKAIGITYGDTTNYGIPFEFSLTFLTKNRHNTYSYKTVFNGLNSPLIYGNIFPVEASEVHTPGEFYMYPNVATKRYLSVPVKSKFIIKGGTVYNIDVHYYDSNLNWLGTNSVLKETTITVSHFESACFIRFSIWEKPTVEQAKADDWSITVMSENFADKTYCNPIVNTMELPDPTIWDGNDGYYYLWATGMNGVWSSSEKTILTQTMWRSANLIDWENTNVRPYTDIEGEKICQAFGYSGDGAFWAPEMFKRKDGKWMLYMVKAYHNGLAVLESDFPTFGFKYQTFLGDTTGMDLSVGSDVFIDPYVAYDRDGELWMYAGCRTIYRRRLNDDAKSFKDASWEVVGGTGAYGTNTAYEAAFLYFREGYWYLFVSGGTTIGSTYRICVVRSQSLNGEFLDKNGDSFSEGNATQIMQDISGDISSTGHNGAIITDKNNKTWMFYHAKYKIVRSAYSTWRWLCIDELKWGLDGWPYFENGKPSLISNSPTM